jgi:hypothetical protein
MSKAAMRASSKAAAAQQRLAAKSRSNKPLVRNVKKPTGGK